MDPMTAPLLELVNVAKQFPGVRALDGVSATLERGEVHVLFGENGAGKSTLISLVAGVHQPTSGEVRFEGEPVTFASVHDARARGISAVFQEFSLVPTLSVAENLFLGDEPRRFGLLQPRRQRAMARELLARIGFDIDVDLPVGRLGRAQQQMVEIAKAFRGDLKLLILDEPTASLSEKETDRLFALVDQLRAQGIGILYITHRLQEIRRIADRITVLRDGRHVATVDARIPEQQLIEMMAGRAIAEIYPAIAHKPGEVMLELDAVSTASGVAGASLTVRRGEVVGIAGLVGCGKSEVMRAAFGADRLTGGTVRFRGQAQPKPRPSAMWRAGFFYLPPDRREDGLVLSFPARANITLPALRDPRHRAWPFGLSPRAERATARQLARRVDLADRNLGRPVGLLSGGNQQKALFAKGLSTDIALYVFDEPTVGVDVGTRATLYALIKELAESGAAVVVISSDLPEVMHLSHRLYVMAGGRVTAELSGPEITETAVLRHFFDHSAEIAS